LRVLCHTLGMARGWESKDVESQVAATEEPKQKPQSGPKTPEQLMREEQLKDLQLSRIRIVNDLATATHPNHRKSLEAALAHLDKKIADLN
jgi:hypothetical protein